MRRKNPWNKNCEGNKYAKNKYVYYGVLLGIYCLYITETYQLLYYYKYNTPGRIFVFLLFFINTFRDFVSEIKIEQPCVRFTRQIKSFIIRPVLPGVIFWLRPLVRACTRQWWARRQQTLGDWPIPVLTDLDSPPPPRRDNKKGKRAPRRQDK